MHLTTVYVVDDDDAVCDSVRFLLESAGFGVHTFSGADSLLDHLDESPFEPGCLVADLRLPRMSGLDMHDALLDRGLLIPTVIITGHGNVSAAVRAMKAGVLDFLEKPFTDDGLLSRVRQAVKLDGEWRSERAERAAVEQRYETLSPKENQVFWAVVKGKLNKQIASEIDRSAKTIEVHRSQAMKKMKAKSLAALVRMAVMLEDGQAWRDRG